MIFDSKHNKLYKAIVQGDTGRVESLLEGDIDLDMVDSDGSTPLVAAAGEGQQSVVRLLLKAGAGVNVPAEGGETPLMAAARRGSAPVMELLIDAGADVNAADRLGYTPLILATVWATRMASIGKSETVSRVSLLLEAGANVNTTDRKGRSAVMAQVRSGGGTLQEGDRLPVLRRLVDGGADVDLAGDRGRTPLMAAAFRGLRETCDLLLDAGANPFLRDNAGRSALMFAAAGAFWSYRKAGYIGIVNTLIDLDCDLREKDSSGMTSLMIARRNKRKDLAHLLKKAGAFE